MNLFANEKPICRCKYGLFTFVDSAFIKKAPSPQNTRNCMAILFYPKCEPDGKYVLFEIEYTYSRESLLIELCKLQNGDDTLVCKNNEISINHIPLGSLDISFEEVLQNLPRYAYGLYNKAVIKQMCGGFIRGRWCRLSSEYNKYNRSHSKLPWNLFEEYIDKNRDYNYADDRNGICYAILGDVICNEIKGVLVDKIQRVIKEVVEYYSNITTKGILCEKYEWDIG